MMVGTFLRLILIVGGALATLVRSSKEVNVSDEARNNGKYSNWFCHYVLYQVLFNHQ